MYVDLYNASTFIGSMMPFLESLFYLWTHFQVAMLEQYQLTPK